jgi:sn-glycerol 3-phosphate transport system ATP-binding protein
MAYGLRIRNLSKSEIDARVKRAAAILELGALLERKPRELSGGQRQRVAMGRAIVREPAVFLFDEPLSNLDAKLRVQMRVELQALHRRLGTTSLYVTHDQVEAMTLAHRMMVMNAGRAEQIGAPLEVYAKPATTFVAAFIGSPPMNLMPARLNGREVLLGVRPEHLELCGESEAAFVAAVDLVEPLGAGSLCDSIPPGDTTSTRGTAHASRRCERLAGLIDRMPRVPRFALERRFPCKDRSFSRCRCFFVAQSRLPADRTTASRRERSSSPERSPSGRCQPRNSRAIPRRVPTATSISR